MAYKEKYALDITPQGDTVRQSIKKNRDEILEVARTVELKSGGGATGLRNRFLNGKISNGEYSFLTGDNLGVTLDGTQTPVIVSFADGYNEFGAVDYVASIDSKVSAWSLLPNKTQYIYVERTGSGAVSYGSTTVKPVRQSTPPDTVLNAMYYNDIMDMMYVYNGSQWERKQRVLIAEVVTDGTSVKTIKYYQPSMNGSGIATGSITSTQIANEGIKSVSIGSGEVKTVNLADKSVTKAKLADDTLKHINDADNAVRSDLTSHKADTAAHKPIFDGFVKSAAYDNGKLKVTHGSGTIDSVNIITSNANDTNLSLGVSLGAVNSIISALHIKDGNDVVQALGNTGLSSIGMEFNTSNPDLWYMKFGKAFNNFTIQGGKRQVGKQVDTRNDPMIFPRQTFATAFSDKCLWMGFTITPVANGTYGRFWGNSAASVFAREMNKTDFTYEVHSMLEGMLLETATMKWIAVGV